MRESGQTQLMMVMVLSTILGMAAMYSLERSQKSSEGSLKKVRTSEMSTALTAALQRAAYLYHQESGCDPLRLDYKLSRLDTSGDGSLYAAGSGSIAGRRQISVDVGGRSYVVGFAIVTRLPWRGGGDPTPVDYLTGGAANQNQVGFSQDAVVRAFTTDGQQRLSRTAVFINNCTYPCAYTSADPTEGTCRLATNADIGYHRITDLNKYPLSSNALLANTCDGGLKKVGELVDGQIDVSSIQILRNYIRNGDTSGSTATRVSGDGSIGDACGDLNRDGMVNEIDVGILEKLLRGYIHQHPF